MSTMPLAQSLICAVLMAFVVAAVLQEPITTNTGGHRSSDAPVQNRNKEQAVQVAKAQAPMMKMTGKAPDYEALQAQVAALSSQVAHLEAKLEAELQDHTAQSTAEREAELDIARLPSPRLAQELPTDDLEARWVGQPDDPDWEVRVESSVAALALDAKELGLGPTALNNADCRGDLCQLKIQSAIPAPMLQHLLTRYVGNIGMIKADRNAQGSYSVFAKQTN